MPSGFFAIDKPEGFTSHDVIAKMRKILGMKKIGHSGTLDPMATGVLIVACGTSTRLLDYVQGAAKEYVATLSFGQATSTGDREGEITNEKDMSWLSADDIRIVLPSFIGEIQQIPPMVSAIKVDGKKLYEYEREGIEVERKARNVVIDSIELEDFIDNPQGSVEATLRVACHTGTYIRTLAEDIASELGGYAHLVSLRRTKNGNINESNLVSLGELEKAEDPWSFLLSPQDALSHYAMIELDGNQAQEVAYGRPLKISKNQEAQISSTEEYFAAYASKPRELIALYLTHKTDESEKIRSDIKSRCIVFLDD